MKSFSEPDKEFEADLASQEGQNRSGVIPDSRPLSPEEVRQGIDLNDEPIHHPKTRGECIDGPRPCPFVSCKHHLYLDVNPRSGSLKLNFPDVDVLDMPGDSCSLDVADRGSHTREAVERVMNAPERAFQAVIPKSLRKLSLKLGGSD